MLKTFGNKRYSKNGKIPNLLLAGKADGDGIVFRISANYFYILKLVCVHAHACACVHTWVHVCILMQSSQNNIKD